MKSVYGLFVLLAVFAVSQGKSVQFLPPFLYPQGQSVISPTIVGGFPTTIADHPHHLAILDLSRGGYLCGASAVHIHWALTAAHCVAFNTPPHLINLWGGSTSRLTGGVIFLITEYILHPTYNVIPIDNDIAVMRINPETPLVPSASHPHIALIPLPDLCPATEACCGACPGEVIHVAGWGRDDSGGLPENLLMVHKPIHNHEQCHAQWSAAFSDMTITSRMFCTTVEDGIDSCNGDSGSAIVLNGIQVGLVSFGSQVCGDGTLPAVYVRNEDPVIRDFIHLHTGL